MPIKEKGQNASQIANKDISTTAPTDGQVLTYSSSSGEWAPAAASGGGGDLSFGGDTFGADKLIGSNDNYALSIETNNSERLKFTNDGRGLSNFTAFAWVWFNDSTNDSGGGDVDSTGRTPDATGSHNVSNVKDGDFSGDEGQYEITFTNAAANTKYCVVAGGDSNTTAYSGSIQGERGVGSFQVFGSEGGSWNDLDELNVLVFASPTA